MNQEQQPLLSPDLIDEEEEYKIEEVLDSRTHQVHGDKAGDRHS